MRIDCKTSLTFTILLSLLLSLFATNCAAAEETTPQRVISLAPHITEMLFSAGAGDKIVGVVNYSDYPAAASKIDSIGDYNAVNIEKIILLKPDLIIAWKTGSRLKDVEKLKSLGFKVIYSEPYQLKDIANEIQYFGQILNTTNTANQVASQLKQQLDSLKKTYQNKPKITAFYQIWNRPLMTINGKQFISQALEICGAKNIFADLPILAAEVNLESIIKRNPDAILLGGEKAFQNQWQKNWQAFSILKAVQENQIYLLNADQFQRPTARLINGIESLCQVVDKVRNESPFKDSIHKID